MAPGLPTGPCSPCGEERKRETNEKVEERERAVGWAIKIAATQTHTSRPFIAANGFSEVDNADGMKYSD